MKSFLQNSWKYLIAILLGIIVGLLISIPSCNVQEKHIIEYIEKHDTITVEKERIVEKTKIKYIDRIDTFYVKESGDTVLAPDLPIEYKVYEDTIKNDSTSTEIKIEYSGFNPEINNIWLRHNYVEKHETVIKTKKIGIVWFVGFSLGYDACVDVTNKTFNHGPGLSLSAGIGIGGTIK